jgi:NAD(P)-dependent dehydrogenase (short-subunit alcohol dehydrogenase family)
VRSPSDATALAFAIADRIGLDAWVSNAGISFMHRFLDAPVERFDQTMDVNLKGVFVCGQAAARAMVRSGAGGAIVNTASMAGKQGRVPFLSDYVASKFGVVGLTQAMAYELGEHDIRVNCVCPGYVETPMQSRELEWEAELRGTTVDGVRTMMLDDTPLRRLEQPEDVALAVAFLLSPDSRFITGEALAVNGGAFMD